MSRRLWLLMALAMAGCELPSLRDPADLVTLKGREAELKKADFRHFVDFVVDVTRTDSMLAHCGFEDGKVIGIGCKPVIADRRNDWPVWDGKAINAGSYGDTWRMLSQAGWICPKPQRSGFEVAELTANGDMATMLCKTTIPQATEIRLFVRMADAKSIRLEITQGSQRLDIPLLPQPAKESGVDELLGQDSNGKVYLLFLAEATNRSQFKLHDALPAMDEATSRRLVELATQQIARQKSKDPMIPTLQQVQQAAHLYARLPAYVLEAARLKPAADSDAETIATIAFGWCRKPDSAAFRACLTPYLMTYRQFGPWLRRAVDEVKAETADLPMDHPVNLHLQDLLDAMTTAES